MDILSETLHLRTEMQTVKDHHEVYVPPKGILANAILTRLPLEVRYNVYSYLWSTDTVAEVDYMALLDQSYEYPRKKWCPFVPNFVDRGIVGPGDFAAEVVRCLYESDQLGIMTKSLQWHDVSKFFRTDVFGVGVAPQDVQIRRLCVELDISGVNEYKTLSRRLFGSLGPLFNAQINRDPHIEIRIAQKVRGSRRDRDQRVLLSVTWRLRHRMAQAVRRLEDVGFSIDITYGLLKQRQDGSYHRTTTIPFDPTLLHEDSTMGQWQRSITDALQAGSGSSNAHLRLW